MSEKTLTRWVKRETAAPFDGIVTLADISGYSLDWIAFGVGPKLRRGSGMAESADRIVRDRAEALYEAIHSEISDFLGRKGWKMSSRRQHQLAEELLDYVIRYDEADTRAAVLEVLIETRIPVVYDEQTSHEKIGSATGGTGSTPSDDPSK